MAIIATPVSRTPVRCGFAVADVGLTFKSGVALKLRLTPCAFGEVPGALVSVRVSVPGPAMMIRSPSERLKASLRCLSFVLANGWCAWATRLNGGLPSAKLSVSHQPQIRWWCAGVPRDDWDDLMAADGRQAKPISLFYSYSHRDEDLRGKLETHLAVLRRGGLITEWHDRKIEAGDKWREEIDRHLRSADIVLLLVSADFFASDYCWGEEMKKALERHRRGEARVIPVILRQCYWKRTLLGELEALPRNGKPIAAWPDKNEACLQVVQAVDEAVKKVQQAKAVQEDPGQNLKPTSTAVELVVGTPEPIAVRAVPVTTERVAARSELPDLTVFRDIEEPWCPELVMIPAGTFITGSPKGEEGRHKDEGPQHKVSFARPFALGRYPVTFDEFDHFCAETHRGMPPDEGWGRGRLPVINVSWEDAGSYCAWLSKRTGQVYRRPSEAEWEYACRAETTTPFWTGATISTEQANYNGNYTFGSGKKGEYRKRTIPVDTFRPNPWGLHDMHGNVSEWCEDLWHNNYKGAPDDGSAWLRNERSGWRVVRGGSWSLRPGILRSASRGRLEPDDRYFNIGFRVARTLRSLPLYLRGSGAEPQSTFRGSWVLDQSHDRARVAPGGRDRRWRRCTGLTTDDP
jgi:formylglycine-generating enzyme required for sulfatase activity